MSEFHSPAARLCRQAAESEAAGGRRCRAADAPTLEVTWIGGWGLSPEQLSPLATHSPGVRLRMLPPSRGAAELAAQSDHVVAWSLGAWRVLEAAAHGVAFRGQVRLFAPFVAFCADYGLGGRCSLTQVRWLKRWLQRDPARALNDFCQRAGLASPPSALPYALEDLLEGLDRLAEDASAGLRTFAAKGLPHRWEAVIGEADPLLDASAVQRSLPGCQIVPGAGHKLEGLLSAKHAKIDAL